MSDHTEGCIYRKTFGLGSVVSVIHNSNNVVRTSQTVLLWPFNRFRLRTSSIRLRYDQVPTMTWFRPTAQLTTQISRSNYTITNMANIILSRLLKIIAIYIAYNEHRIVALTTVLPVWDLDRNQYCKTSTSRHVTSLHSQDCRTGYRRHTGT